MKKLVITLITTLLLANCASTKKEVEKNYESAEALYTEAVVELNKKEIAKASELFEQLEKEFPYSKWAIKGQLMYAYLQYAQNNFAASIASLERFLQLYPLHQNADYAYYLIALNNYDQINNAGRDQQDTYKALNSLEEVINRFPDSPYAKDAKVKLDLVHEHLAAQEMSVGRFYLKKNNIIGALNRFKTVVDRFNKTIHVAEALFRLTEIYYSMGLVNEAQKYASILGYNFPHNPWYHKAYELLKGVKSKEKWYKIF
ncbi:MAG: outer membrane protein assembly factor BamD [Sphingobacteriia bacterium]|nr:outer membrane protein assembly factor BamD [Sphingobacteriia bacterium]